MSKSIRRIRARGVYGRFDFDLDFQEGINIVYGHNGTGKTTLLHILTNAVNADYIRFGYLSFSRIEVLLDSNDTLKIERTKALDSDEWKISVFIDDSPVFSFTREEFREGRLAREKRTRIEKARIKHDLSVNATYFPAFRTMIEAWASLPDRESGRITGRFEIHESTAEGFSRVVRRRSIQATEFARTLFGNFVPTLNYPSPVEIEEQLNAEIAAAVFRVATTDQALLSDAFVKAFAAISQGPDSVPIEQEPEAILEDIAKLSERLQESPLQGEASQAGTVYSRLRQQLASFRLDSESRDIAKRVLAVYQHSLQNRVEAQERAFAGIYAYLDSVNQFLENKKLTVQYKSGNHGIPRTRIQFEDESTSDLQSLSSGERQIIGLIYAASHMRESNVVLIDEPEISLHVDWQRNLLPAMVRQLPTKQLIVCTHSPVIGAQYEDRMKELRILRTAAESAVVDSSDESDVNDEESTF